MKLFLKIVAALLLLVVLALVGLVLFFDPNTLKPRIEALAREQNIALNMQGDLSWQFYPALGFQIEDVQAAPLQTPDQPIANVGEASLRLAIRPLFRGDVEVHHVLIDGAVIDLMVDEQGRGNWEQIVAEEPAATEPAPQEAEPAEGDGEGEETTDLKLAVERISLRNTRVSFTDHSAAATAESGSGGEPLQLALQNIQLEIEQFNLQGDAFTLEAQWQTLITDASTFGPEPVAINGELQAAIQLAQDFSAAEVNNGHLRLRFTGDQEATDLNLDFQATASEMQENLRFRGELNLAPFNAKALLTALRQDVPETAADYALTQVGLGGNFSGDSNSFGFEPFTVTLDKTSLNGSFQLLNFESGAMNVRLEGDQINVDDYLPPESAEDVTETPEATGDEVLIPLEVIRSLNARVSADFNRVVVAGFPIENIRLRLQAEEGLVSLQQADAQVYGGALATKGSLDARGETALIAVETGVQKLQLNPLMADLEFDERLELSGTIDTAASLRTQGVTMNQLMETARGQINFAGDQVRVAPLNVEEKFCQIVDLVNQREAGNLNWPQYTEMAPLAATVSLQNQVINVDSFTAGVERLQMVLRGQVSLAEGTYDLTMPLTLTSPQTSSNGCQVRSEWWLNRTLSLLRCRGTLEGLDPVSDCRPDSKGLTQLVRDFGAHRLREQHGDKIDAAEQRLEEAKDDLRRKAEEKLGGEEAQQKLEEKLKGLFRR